MRRSGLGLLLVACGLAACGGSTRTKTVTVTKTGVVAADGTYRMRFRNSDYTGENIVVRGPARSRGQEVRDDVPGRHARPRRRLLARQPALSPAVRRTSGCAVPRDAQ